MADTLALGASAARHGGSSPLPCTGRDIRKSAFADFFVHGRGLERRGTTVRVGVAEFFSRKISVTKPRSFCLREDLKTFDSFL